MAGRAVASRPETAPAPAPGQAGEEAWVIMPRRLLRYAKGG